MASPFLELAHKSFLQHLQTIANSNLVFMRLAVVFKRIMRDATVQLNCSQKSCDLPPISSRMSSLFTHTRAWMMLHGYIVLETWI
jgi:hypothetical protein